MRVSQALPQTDAIRLSGDWRVQPVPLDAPFSPQQLAPDWIAVPECAHLQPTLYPDQPYWGERIRAVNDHAWVYQRSFKAPLGDHRRARLRFEGVDYYAEVWVNDAFAGRHEGHFAPFDFDVTRLLRGEDATLTVRVSAPWDAPNPSGTYPSNHVIRGLVKGLYEHGEGVIPPAVNPIGIWRPVWLLLDQGVSVEHVGIRTELDGRVSVQVRVSNSTHDLWCGSLQLVVQGDNHKGRGVGDGFPLAVPPGVYSFDFNLRIPNVRWWWSWDQGAPDLYRLDALLLNERGQVIDSRRERFGVRTVRLERSPERFSYWLNERPVFIRGTSYMPSLYLSQTSPESLAHDLALARDANLNLLRVHVHVSPPELYDLCDRAGMLVWQDSELNWIHDNSPQFEERARRAQREMIDLLGNHPSIITWSCHNEPTMVFTQRQNLERHPDPALYADALAQDPTRPVFLSSGQLETDWRRSGDSHWYYGAIWSRRYTDAYHHRTRLNTEFGFEAPAALDTLRAYPELWGRLGHLEGKIEALWAYQAALTQYQVEHFRRLRASGCAGYVHFWLVDLVPQVGCGVLDASRVPKGGYEALRRASQPLHIALEHDGRKPIALWVFNDTLRMYEGARVKWQVADAEGKPLLDGEIKLDIRANASQQVTSLDWSIPPASCARVTLQLWTATGELLCENDYAQPFRPPTRPEGYPWKFDPYLGTKVFDRADALSLADQNISPLLKRIPLRVREAVAEWAIAAAVACWLGKPHCAGNRRRDAVGTFPLTLLPCGEPSLSHVNGERDRTHVSPSPRLRGRRG